MLEEAPTKAAKRCRRGGGRSPLIVIYAVCGGRSTTGWRPLARVPRAHDEPVWRQGQGVVMPEPNDQSQRIAIGGWQSRGNSRVHAKLWLVCPPGVPLTYEAEVMVS